MPDNNIEYIVMPDLEGSPPTDGGDSKMTKEVYKSWNKKIIFSAFAVIILAVFGTLGYKYFTKPEPAPDDSPNEIVVDQNAPETDNLDFDKDGLKNSQETSHQTKIDDPDTDDDGLADGDEVNVYESNPLIADTDGDTFSDAQEITGGYSPIINSSQRADSTEKQKWLTRSVSFGLHEPTTATLKSNTEAGPPINSPKTLYVNQFYNYSIEYPSELSLREEGSGQIVGIAVTGSELSDDINQDPFVIGLAGTKETLSLREWAETRFSAERYEITESTINAQPTVRISEKPVSNECGEDKTFYARESQIMSITWNCSTLIPLESFYEELILSFRFK